MRPGGIYVHAPEAERVEVPAAAADVARRRTAELLALWHWERTTARAVPGPRVADDPLADLAAASYLQGVADAGTALAHGGVELGPARPRMARVVDWT